MIVRECLKTTQTPYMLTTLADLTGDISYYEKAWILSCKRFARAKRSLARVYFDKKDYLSCCNHITEALFIQPMVSEAWYLKGIACMHLEKWLDAIESFQRCVQQDQEIGEAWANIGAIYMKMNKLTMAQSALEEALKHKSGDWRILENLLAVLLGLKK